MFFNDYLSLVEKIKRKQLAKCTPLEYMIRNATPHLRKPPLRNCINTRST